MDRYSWTIERNESLTAGVRTFLLAEYGYNAPAEHTRAAVVAVRSDGLGGRVVLTFPFTFVLASALTGDTENLIAAEARARLTAYRNTQPIASILDRRHAL